jgi:hypothetical protein
MINELRARKDYIREIPHPYLPLLLWNYNEKCQFDGAWDEYTLIARGLITDLEGNIKYKCIPKFFNLNQHEVAKLENLPAEMPEIHEKVDGSMIITYWDEWYQIWRGATRGSFTSEQAILASDWLLDSKLPLQQHYSYIWELVHPLNRIVVDYGDTFRLVLLAIYDGEVEIDITEESLRLGVERANICDFNSIDDILARCKQIKGTEEEGFVLKYSTGLRVKIKAEEYLKMHRMISTLTNLSIWENLSNGIAIDYSILPDEYHKWFKQVRGEFIDSYDRICGRIGIAYFTNVEELPTRKEKAIYIQQNHPDIAGALFSLMDGKKYDKFIWKMLRPEVIYKASSI